jgi:nucleoside-diphosphate-sugar epimerase
MFEQFPQRAKPKITTVPSDDPRSYRISSEKIKNELGFIPRYTIEDAVRDLIKAFQAQKLPDSLQDIRYYNIKTMKAVNLK